MADMPGQHAGQQRLTVIKGVKYCGTEVVATRTNLSSNVELP